MDIYTHDKRYLLIQQTLSTVLWPGPVLGSGNTEGTRQTVPPFQGRQMLTMSIPRGRVLQKEYSDLKKHRVKLTKRSRFRSQGAERVKKVNSLLS